ncbi:hypothetical protein [Pectobacterium carotovorum]|uniref:hypothetical protein n=1 Tax=Pectobacterium carotovorum TaxID=554 RepID=UPI003018236B
MFHEKYDVPGCRVQLNPNGSDIRCGDKVNNRNWNPNEGVVQLCPICQLKRQNNSLIEMLNRKTDKGES